MGLSRAVSEIKYDRPIVAKFSHTDIYLTSWLRGLPLEFCNGSDGAEKN